MLFKLDLAAAILVRKRIFGVGRENEVNVYIWDITGRIVEKFSFGKGTINKQVLLSNCKAGLYFVKITVGNQSVFKDKLIVKQ